MEVLGRGLLNSLPKPCWSVVGTVQSSLVSRVHPVCTSGRWHSGDFSSHFKISSPSVVLVCHEVVANHTHQLFPKKHQSLVHSVEAIHVGVLSGHHRMVEPMYVRLEDVLQHQTAFTANIGFLRLHSFVNTLLLFLGRFLWAHLQLPLRLQVLHQGPKVCFHPNYREHNISTTTLSKWRILKKSCSFYTLWQTWLNKTRFPTYTRTGKRWSNSSKVQLEYQGSIDCLPSGLVYTNAIANDYSKVRNFAERGFF